MRIQHNATIQFLPYHGALIASPSCDKRNTECVSSGTGEYGEFRKHALCARTRRGSAHLVRLLIDHGFNGEESPNSDSQEHEADQ